MEALYNLIGRRSSLGTGENTTTIRQNLHVLQYLIDLNYLSQALIDLCVLLLSKLWVHCWKVLDKNNFSGQTHRCLMDDGKIRLGREKNIFQTGLRRRGGRQVM